MNAQIILAVAAILLGPLVGLLVAYKRFSGRIESTEAARLWEAQEKFRADLERRNEFLREALDSCSDKIDLLNERVNQLEDRNNELYLENGELRRRVVELEATINGLRSENATIKHDYEILKRENASLKKRIIELESNESHQ